MELNPTFLTMKKTLHQFNNLMPYKVWFILLVNFRNLMRIKSKVQKVQRVYFGNNGLKLSHYEGEKNLKSPDLKNVFQLVVKL